jgi:uncharacterized protein YneF (UPF0154 family)
MEGVVISIFIILLFLGIFLVCIYHVVKSAIKDALKENRNDTKLLIREEIHNALKEHV